MDIFSIEHQICENKHVANNDRLGYTVAEEKNRTNESLTELK